MIFRDIVFQFLDKAHDCHLNSRYMCTPRLINTVLLFKLWKQIREPSFLKYCLFSSTSYITPILTQYYIAITAQHSPVLAPFTIPEMSRRARFFTPIRQFCRFCKAAGDISAPHIFTWTSCKLRFAEIPRNRSLKVGSNR